jgi:chromosome segregation ATPase
MKIEEYKIICGRQMKRIADANQEIDKLEKEKAELQTNYNIFVIVAQNFKKGMAQMQIERNELRRLYEEYLSRAIHAEARIEKAIAYLATQKIHCNTAKVFAILEAKPEGKP